MAVMVFTNRYAAKVFTQKRRENGTTPSYITWDMYSKVMTRKQAIAHSSNEKLYTSWRDAARERIPGFA